MGFSKGLYITVPDSCLYRRGLDIWEVIVSKYLKERVKFTTPRHPSYLSSIVEVMVLQITPEELDAKLKGTTYRVLVYLLNRTESVGVRELQRELRLSSPGVAAYHLEKLMRLGLVAKDERGDYLTPREARADLVGATIKIRRLRLPRYLFYSVFYTTVFIIYVAFFYGSPLEIYFLLTLGITGIAFRWYEVWKLKN
jgi:DNA-binding transcriptional ArsR family regulator